MLGIGSIRAAAALTSCFLFSGSAFAQQAALTPPKMLTISTETNAGVPSRFPPGCAVALREGRSDVRYLPRVALLVANYLPYAVKVTVHERMELGPGHRELGIVEALGT